MAEKLSSAFYTRSDVVQVARDLIGKYICTRIDGILTGGRIVETEAYSGENDMACHANAGKRTPRTEIMYHEGGVALTGDLIWLQDRQEMLTENQIIASPRVGVAYAGEDARHPWRFRLHGSPWTSPAK